MAIEAVQAAAGERLIAPQAAPEDFEAETSLRPTRLEEYIGQVGEDELKAAVLRDKVTDYLVDECIQVEQSDESE